MVPRTTLGFWFRSQRIPTPSSVIGAVDQQGLGHTLFAGFVFNFSKIFWDWAFVAELMMPVRFYVIAPDGRGWVGVESILSLGM